MAKHRLYGWELMALGVFVGLPGLIFIIYQVVIFPLEICIWECSDAPLLSFMAIGLGAVVLLVGLRMVVKGWRRTNDSLKG